MRSVIDHKMCPKSYSVQILKMEEMTNPFILVMTALKGNVNNVN